MKFIELLKKKLSEYPFFSDPKYVKQRALIIPAIVLVFAILIAVLVTVPQVFKLIETFKTIGELNEKKSFYKQKASELEAINLSDYRNDLNTSLVALPTEKDIPGVMGEILVSFGSSGMRLNGINFSPGSDDASDKATEFTVSIDASGTEASLRNFLERVTLAPRLIKITAIDVENISTGSVNAKISFATFYQSLPTTIGAVDEPLPQINNEDTQVLTDIEAKVQKFPKTTTQESSGSAKGKLNPFSP